MNPKKMLVDIIASDQRIWDYNKSPTKRNADNCIKAYEEAIIKFCEEFDKEDTELVCRHRISLNKMCGMEVSRGKTIVWVGCENCGNVIEVDGDQEYIDRMNKIMTSY